MLNKNLESINNPILQRRLARISPEESRVGIAYCITPTNDYVLLKNDLPTDDLNNPREAAKKMIKDNIHHEMNKNDTIIIFGLGLGYLLDEVYQKFPCKIYIYEPDLMLMHFVLSNADISEHLASGRVFITNDMDELLNKLSSTFLTKDKVEIVYIQNYAIVKNKELLLLTQKVYDVCKSKIVDVNTIAKFSKRWLINTVNNIAAISNNNYYLLSDLENKFIGQTALIAGAGPSLSENITKIQANRDKFVIFAVNKVVKYLLQNGITPDFVVGLDARNMDKTLGELEGKLNHSNCILDIRTDSSILNKGFAKSFVNFSETDFFIKKLAKKNSFMKFYEAGGSASTLALVSAIKLGFSKIVFAGVDLAFKDNQIYAYGENMNRVSQSEIIVDSVKKNLVQVKAVNGGIVYTRDDYAAFIHHFETIIKELNYSEIYNISSFGAHIEGVKAVSFEDLNLSSIASLAPTALVQPFKFELKDFIEEEFFHINNIITMLSKGVFSPALLASIVKSGFIYQYMQSEILEVLQKNYAPELAEPFINKTKAAIKTVVELLQKNKLV